MQGKRRISIADFAIAFADQVTDAARPCVAESLSPIDLDVRHEQRSSEMTTRTSTDTQAGEARARNVSVLLILGALVALGPLSTDAYVPGLPRLADDLRSSASTAQLTVTTCLVGLAVGQLLAGPMSDALGRRRPLLLGLAVYATAGFLCAIATT